MISDLHMISHIFFLIFSPSSSFYYAEFYNFLKF